MDEPRHKSLLGLSQEKYLPGSTGAARRCDAAAACAGGEPGPAQPFLPCRAGGVRSLPLGTRRHRWLPMPQLSPPVQHLQSPVPAGAAALGLRRERGISSGINKSTFFLSIGFILVSWAQAPGEIPSSFLLSVFLFNCRKREKAKKWQMIANTACPGTCVSIIAEKLLVCWALFSGAL